MKNIFCMIDDNYFNMERGDSFSLPLFLNKGTKLDVERYDLTETDILYVGITETNQSFEDALIRKRLTNKDVDADGNIVFSLQPSDTERVVPGKYFITIKLVKDDKDVITVMKAHEFFITGSPIYCKDYERGDC